MYEKSDIQFMPSLKAASFDYRIIKEILKHLAATCFEC